MLGVQLGPSYVVKTTLPILDYHECFCALIYFNLTVITVKLASVHCDYQQMLVNPFAALEYFYALHLVAFYLHADRI